jgi:DNA-binding transcriptional regulator GbsR (MarR family)
MSYSRSYSEVISGVEHVSYSYPASEEGGSDTIAVHWSEPVYIDINVDTHPFDSSVHSLKTHVDVLTGSVVAMEVAHVKEKVEGAKRVADCVTDGFFKLIRSEISQQTTALKNRVDSSLLKLNDLRVACRRVQETMQLDYSRITERYSKIFEELDRETKKRISSIDSAAISVRSQVSEQPARAICGLCTEATISAAENSAAQIKVTAGAIRAQVHKLLQNATAYLAQERTLTRDVQMMLFDSGSLKAGMTYLPVLYLEADAHSGVISRSFLPDGPNSPVRRYEVQTRELFQQRELKWADMDENSRTQVERFLMPLVDGIQGGDREHDARVRQSMMQLWKSSLPQML